MNEKLKPHGVVSAIAAASLFGLIVIGAFVVDFGGYYVARSELQNSADAGALAGAGRIVKNGVPGWTEAHNTAEEVGRMNRAHSGVVPTVGVIIGYWNFRTNQMLDSGIRPTADHLPAVKVTASRTKANNNELKMSLAYFLDQKYFDISVNAMAVISGPGYVDQRDLFPFAMSECMYQQYWDYTRSPPGPLLGSNGQPLEFLLPGTYGACQDNTMAWTGLGFGSNAASIKTIVERYQTSNPIPSERFALGAMVPIWGGAASPYNEIERCTNQPGGDGRCALVTVVVVDQIPKSANGERREIKAFSCLEILQSNPPKSVRVRMSTSCTPPNSGGTGPIFGTVTPPALVQ